MHRLENKWTIHCCGGNNIQDLATLKTLGLLDKTVQQLITAEKEAETTLPADLRQKFSSFQGLTNMHGDKTAHSKK